MIELHGGELPFSNLADFWSIMWKTGSKKRVWILQHERKFRGIVNLWQLIASILSLGLGIIENLEKRVW